MKMDILPIEQETGNIYLLQVVQYAMSLHQLSPINKIEVHPLDPTTWDYHLVTKNGRHWRQTFLSDGRQSFNVENTFSIAELIEHRSLRDAIFSCLGSGITDLILKF